jgi:hypothetical protein
MGMSSRKYGLIFMVVALLYISGYFLLYPLFSSYTAGSSYHRFVAHPASVIHEIVYAPSIKYFGPSSLYTTIWLWNTKWWCNKINGEVFCEKHIAQLQKIT